VTDDPLDVFREAMKPWDGLKLNAFAAIYQISRQNIYKLSKKYNLTPDDWACPLLLHAQLVERATDSTLRRRLACPLERDRLQTLILEKENHAFDKFISNKLHSMRKNASNRPRKVQATQ
jgi:hypothetical protein